MLPKASHVSIFIKSSKIFLSITMFVSSRTLSLLIFTYVWGRSNSQELANVKLSIIAFAFASTLALVKCIIFLDGTNPNGNNDKKGVILFCLVNNLLGFACFNDYFMSTLFFVPCLLVTDLKKLQNTNVRKETC